MKNAVAARRRSLTFLDLAHRDLESAELRLLDHPDDQVDVTALYLITNARFAIMSAEGALRGEDVVLLTSDAVSAWLLRRDEEGRPAWRLAAFELGEQLPFEALIDEARQDGMRNDDSTLVRIRFQAR